MKAFLFVAALSVFYTGCVAVECKEEGELLPNPEDCTSFYQCVGGVPIKESCPDGLHWSQSIKACDYPENAHCEETTGNPTEGTTVPNPGTSSEGTPSEGTPEPPTSAPGPNECPEVDDPENDVLLPNPDDCGSFFKCLGGKPYLIECPPGQEFSVELKRCDWPDVAKCSQK